MTDSDQGISMKSLLEFLVMTSIVMSLTGVHVSHAMELNGVLATENNMGIKDWEFFNFRNANWFQLKISAAPHENVSVKANLELRNTNFTRVQTIDELWDRGTLEPISWRINEAYMDIFGFLLDNDWVVLDLRVGKQVLAWGEGDGFNPSNKFDPINLENPMDFENPLGNVSLKAVLSFGDDLMSLEGVVIPRFLPGLIPVDLFLGDDPLDNPLMPFLGEEQIRANLPPGMEGLQVSMVQPAYDVMYTRTPDATASNIMGGLRLIWSLWGFDWSVSWAHARENIPYPYKFIASTTIEAPGQEHCSGDVSCLVMNLDSLDLIYPEVDTIGFNFRGSLGDVGLWGELAVNFPEKVDLHIQASDPLGNEQPEMVLPGLDGEPYTKWVLGGEYTFSGGYYMNLQWIHGFFTEMSGHKVHDYLFVVFRKSLLSERLLMELSLGGELDHNLGNDAIGAMGDARLTYKPYDGAEIAIGYLMSRGEDGTTLDSFEQLDQVYLRFRSDF